MLKTTGHIVNAQREVDSPAALHLVQEPIVIELIGPPRGKGRPRFVRATGRTFTDPQTEEYERNLKLVGALAMRGRNPIAGPVAVLMEAHFAVPSSWSGKKQRSALADLVRHVTKPDADNLLKMLDGLNGVVWVDDAQICELQLIKRYALKPLTKITVRIL
jgi:Holliday junction resolvase RusA-like endonuclease